MQQKKCQRFLFSLEFFNFCDVSKYRKYCCQLDATHLIQSVSDYKNILDLMNFIHFFYRNMYSRKFMDWQANFNFRIYNFILGT